MKSTASIDYVDVSPGEVAGDDVDAVASPITSPVPQEEAAAPFLVSADIHAVMLGLWASGLRCVIVYALAPVIGAAGPLAVGAAPAAPGYENQEAFIAVLGFVPRIVVASLAGYLVGQFLNAWVLVKLKQWREGKGMWKRLLGSTVVGEAADTTIFCLIAFGGQIDGGTMLNYIVVGYLFKVSVEAVLLPVTYRVISLVRSREPEPTKV